MERNILERSTSERGVWRKMFWRRREVLCVSASLRALRLYSSREPDLPSRCKHGQVLAAAHKAGGFADGGLGCAQDVAANSVIIARPMEYTVIIEPADDGTFSVYVPDLPGCVSTGRTREEAIESIREAIAGHVQTLRELGEPVPPPRSQSQVVAP